MTKQIFEDDMSHQPPKLDPRVASAPPIPAPEPADYSDEVTAEQVEVLRRYAPQNPAKMGPLVHEFTW